MADFTADVAQLESLKTELNMLGSQADDIAASVGKIGRSLGGIKSLANKGYPGKISAVDSAISKAADGTKTASARMGKIASTYSSCETAAKSAIMDAHAGQAAIKGYGFIAAGLAGMTGGVASEAKRYMRVASNWIGAGKSELAKTLNDLNKNWRDAGEALDDLRKWRSKEGSDLVIAGAAILGGVPRIGGLLKNTTEYYAKEWGKKAKKYEKIYDGVQASMDGLGHLKATGDIDTKSSDTAVSGFNAFASELGIPDFYAIKTKYEKRGDAVIDEANRMLKNGSSKSEAYVYAISGTLLTIGELCADTSFQGVKTFVKFSQKLSGFDAELKAIHFDAATAAITGDTLDGHIDDLLGGVGNKLRSGLKPFASNFK